MALKKNNEQAQLILPMEYSAIEPPSETDLSTTFNDNLTMPLHRWFRYTAGFSASWVRQTINSEYAAGRRNVLDPFAGTGTTILEAEQGNMEAVGVEAHPFISRVAQAKLFWRICPTTFREYALSLLDSARSTATDISHYSPLILQCYSIETLHRLDALRRVWSEESKSPLSELFWLGLVSILRECASVNVANCTYVLPGRLRDKTVDPFAVFRIRVCQMAEDMAFRQQVPDGPPSHLYCADARTCALVPDNWAHLIITSPPYVNNYDYADATRLEMTFFGDIKGWSDLQESVRQYLVRSCSQQVGQFAKQTDIFVNDPLVAPIAEDLRAVVDALASERENHGGKKNYHTMIAAYFCDLAKVWMSLRRVTAPGGRICMIIGDSAPYGIHVPVEKWLGELAVASGFIGFHFEKTRDRNIKWKNRKHRVPLQEGRLWVEG